MKKHRNIWIAIVVFFLLVNTYKLWSYDLGVTGIVYILNFALFIVLAVISIVQLIKLFREKFQDYSRRVLTAALITVLFLAYEWPAGILPGTAPLDKFEKLTLENTGLDLHGYSYEVINDSIENTDPFLGDYYYSLTVQFDSIQFAEIEKKIKQTPHYDDVPKFRQEPWDSLHSNIVPGAWDDDDQYIWFAENPKISAAHTCHFSMHFDKLKRQACIVLIQT